MYALDTKLSIFNKKKFPFKNTNDIDSILKTFGKNLMFICIYIFYKKTLPTKEFDKKIFDIKIFMNDFYNYILLQKS